VTETVWVELPEQRRYPIHVGSGVRARLGAEIARLSDVSRVAVIADQHVAELHLDRLLAALPGQPTVLTFPPGEPSKSLATFERLLGELADARIERSDLVVTFGGGVAGDLGGFVAACWLRGVRFMQVPTTIEAAVDASVGGKTAVNHAAGKNLIGAFHQPSAVLIDTDFLGTLAARDYTAGLAESIKHAAIRDPDFLTWHEQHAAAIVARDPQVLTPLIARNCTIKADVVARDEREAHLRAILNYGHTLGHAFELLLDYELRHGECVALGMLAENALAQRCGRLDAAVAQRLHASIAQLGLPTRLPRALPPADVLAACRLDKKNKAGRITFVILDGLGVPVRFASAEDADIVAALASVQPA
jgi:3-dehydroquinate synthase